MNYKEEAMKGADCEPDTDEHVARSLLISALNVGPKKAQEFSGFPRERCLPIIENFERNGVFTKDGKVSIDTGDGFDEQIAIGFLMAVAVGLGFIRRGVVKRKLTAKEQITLELKIRAAMGGSK